MSRIRIQIAVLCLLLGGCAQHFYEVEGDNVTLYLRAPGINNPLFACSMDSYATHSPQYHSGKWVVTLPGSKPFRYFYLVDNKLFLPECAMKENDDFGSQSCIYEPGM
ncbi:MAG: hypothetical protein ACN4GW_03335 [Desulforhopalus sp.]